MKITSPSFDNNDFIPEKYTCDGRVFLSPPLVFSDVPKGAKSLVLVMDDPDVPKQLKADGMFDHWIIYNIPPGTEKLIEGDSPGTPGINSAGKNCYTGPCPPPQYEPSTHRYFFKLYALDTMLDIPKNSDKKAVEAAMQGHIIEKAEVIGLYKRNK